MLITRPALAAGVTAALLGLAGCSTGFTNLTIDVPRPAPAAIHQKWPGCTASGAFIEPTGDVDEKADAGSLPKDFVPESAIVCALDWGPGETDPPYQVGVERRATDLDELITYLDRPSRRSTRPDSLACITLGYEPVWLVLVDGAGRWIAPQIPTDPCGFPLDMFSETGQLPWTTPAFSDRVVCSTQPRSREPCR